MSKITVLLLMTLVAIGHGYPLQEQIEFIRHSLMKRDVINTWTLDSYPNPREQFLTCSRDSPSNVCDPNNILTKAQANNLDYRISGIKNETNCACQECPDPNSGISVGVAIMKNMRHEYQISLSNSSEDLSTRAETFARGLMKQWNFGKCDDAIIVLLATENQQSYIISGERVKHVISDDILNAIFNAVRIHFENGNYYQGLESVIESIYDKAKGVLIRAPQQEEEKTSTGSVGLTIGLVVGFLALAVLFAAGVIVVRKRQQNQGDKFAYDSHKPGSKRDQQPKTNIVKLPVVFPDAVYQPCSIEDPAGNYKRGSDEEINFTERKPATSQVDSNMPDVHNGRMRHELSRVDEEDSKDILDDIDVDDPEEKIVFAQTHPNKPQRKVSGPKA